MTVTPDELARMFERGEITQDRVLFMNEQEFTIPRESLGTSFTQQPLFREQMRQSVTRSQRLAKLNVAHLNFFILGRQKGLSNMDFERAYREFYNDIKSHHDEWFGDIFNPDRPGVDPVHAERSTGILGTLCTILRQKGDLEGCMEVMPTYMQVLQCFRDMTIGRDVCQEQIDECEGLTYKANLIRINCGLQLPDKDMAIKAFRDVVAHEKQKKRLGTFNEDLDADFDGMAAMLIGHDCYEKVSDDEIYQALRFICGMTQKDAGKKDDDSEARTCSCCEKKEECRGDFKLCSRCHKQLYCSKKCQANDWKTHKQLCGERNTTNIPTDHLLVMAKQLVKNHSATVDVRTTCPLSPCQKRDALAALVGTLKQWLTGKYQQYNDVALVHDAATCPSFVQDLADFFAMQSGYEEVWSKLRVGCKETMEKEQELAKEQNVLNVSEDLLRDLCRNIAQHSVISLGRCELEEGDSSDGLTSNLIEPAKFNEFVEELLNLHKSFMLSHPEFNSHAGMKKMNTNEAFLVELTKILAVKFGGTFKDDQAMHTD